jgi:hypothetical protein
MFNGILPYTPIAVDNFKIVSGVSIFFLTHFHADHYGGLSARFNAGPIYCSEVTRDLVLTKFKINPDIITGLDVGSTYSIPLAPVQESKTTNSDSDQLNQSIETTPKGASPSPECTVVNVTLFPSDHCPGSVMILFESYFGRYLHTGDFRFNSALVPLYAPIVRNPVDRVFLDATFAAPFWYLPKRNEAIEQIIALMEQQPSNCEFFFECTMLGCEEIYKRLYQRFKKKIHLDPEKYDEFLCEPDLENILTAIGSETSVHMCRSGTFVLVSEEVESITRFNYERNELRKLTKEEREEEDSSVAARKLEMASLIKKCQSEKRPYLLIKPSTQWFGQQQMDSSTSLNPRPVKDCYGIWHVLYSIHSSHKEIMEFLKLIQPLHITPITECDRSVLKLLHQHIHKDAAKLRRSSVTVPVKIAQLMRQVRKTGSSNVDAKSRLDKLKKEEVNANRRLSLEERSATAYGFVKQSFVGKKRKSMSDETEAKNEWETRKRQKQEKEMSEYEVDQKKEVNEEIAEIMSFQQEDKFQVALQSIENDKSGEIPMDNNDQSTIQISSSGELILEYRIDEYEILDKAVKKDGTLNEMVDRTPDKESQKSEIDENERMLNDLVGSDNSSGKALSDSLFKPIGAHSNIETLNVVVAPDSSPVKVNSGHNSSFDEDNLFSQVVNDEKVDEKLEQRNGNDLYNSSLDQDSNLFDEVLKEKESSEEREKIAAETVRMSENKKASKKSEGKVITQTLRSLFQPSANLSKIPKVRHVNKKINDL